MAERTNFELYRNTAIILRFQLTTPEPAPDYVTGWTTVFTVKNSEQDANTVLSIPGALSTIPNALQKGIFDVFVSAANTALLNDGQHYDWSFRRTDSGFEDVLALGELKAWTTC
jgi:hypothetical protein